MLLATGTLAIDVKFTPASDAGSLRFSARAREASGQDDSPWQLSDWDVTKLKLLRLWKRYGLSVIMLAAVFLARRFVWRHTTVLRSERVAKRLLQEEAAAKRALLQEQSAAAAPQLTQGSGAALVSTCRFCDIAVADEHADAHVRGKRHLKLVAAAASLCAKQGVSLDDCWVWREAAPALRAAEDAGDAAADDAPSAYAAPSRGGKWETAAKKGGNEAGGATRRKN